MKKVFGIFPVIYVEENGYLDIGGPFIPKPTTNSVGIIENSQLFAVKQFYVYTIIVAVITIVLYAITLYALLIPLIGSLIWNSKQFQYYVDVAKYAAFGRAMEETYQIKKDTVVDSVVDLMNVWYPSTTDDTRKRLVRMWDTGRLI